MNATQFSTILATLVLYLSVIHADRFPEDAYFRERHASMCVGRPRVVRWVFENHFKQLNACNVGGLKRERTRATKLFFGPRFIEGETAVDEVFLNFCKPRREGGFNGLQFVEKKAFIVGNVINVLWVANAPFLEEPYPGSDAYVTCGRKMLSMVSTFDESELKIREGFSFNG